MFLIFPDRQHSLRLARNIMIIHDHVHDNNFALNIAVWGLGSKSFKEKFQIARFVVNKNDIC